MTDISFDLDGFTVHLRAGAIVTRGDDVVVCRLRTENWWYLPGGRIKTNESSVDALARELREEIGEFFRIVRPIVLAENFFTLHAVSFHEICIFYAVEWLDGNQLSESDSRDEVVVWVPKTSLPALDLRPTFIKQFVLTPPATLQLVIHRDSASGE